MKKKFFVVIAIIVVLVILLTPVRMNLKDGGSARYKALVYEVTKIHQLSPEVDGVKMSCIQFFVCGIASLPFMFLTETPQIGNILDARMPILYAGVMSCGMAYTLQILGQNHANPAIASLLLSMESCFSVLSGWIILGETLSAREGIGCVLMFVAIILAQLPDKREKLKNGQA